MITLSAKEWLKEREGLVRYFRRRRHGSESEDLAQITIEIVLREYLAKCEDADQVRVCLRREARRTDGKARRKSSSVGMWPKFVVFRAPSSGDPRVDARTPRGVEDVPSDNPLQDELLRLALRKQELGAFVTFLTSWRGVHGRAIQGRLVRIEDEERAEEEEITLPPLTEAERSAFARAKAAVRANRTLVSRARSLGYEEDSSKYFLVSENDEIPWAGRLIRVMAVAGPGEDANDRLKAVG